MTYNELISRFTIYDNPPKKDGYDRHHIVPESEQKKLYGSVADNRQIYCSLPMHMWLHILYDREHGTKTAARFLSVCGKSAEYFDCWEKCLAYSYTLRKKREEGYKKSAEVQKTTEFRQKRSDAKKGDKNPCYGRIGDKNPMYGRTGDKNPFYGQHHSEEIRKKISDSKKGNTSIKGQKFFNDGTKNVVAFECPEGFVPGRLYQRRTI